MNLQYTLEQIALQLKNQPRILKNVAKVFEKIMKKLYETHFPNAETQRRGPVPNCPDSDILPVAWLLEYMGVDSERSGYPRIQTELKSVFPCLPERSRFTRRRNLSLASERLRQHLTRYFPLPDVFIVDSFPMPLCDFKRAKTSRSDLKWADGTGLLATYGKCATKSLGTFFGFRGSLITTVEGLPIDFGIAGADTDDREVLRYLCERGNRYPIILEDKGYVSVSLGKELLETAETVLFPTLRSNQRQQYPEGFQKLQVRLRRRIETTIAQLTEQFGVSRIRARTHWGLQTRMNTKFGACLLGAFLNQCLGHPLMKLKDLVLA